MSKIAIDGEAIRALAALLAETGLNEIEYSSGDNRLRVVAKTEVVVAPAAASAPPSVPTMDKGSPLPTPNTVTAPLVGIVYLSPEPGTAPFVTKDQAVSADDTVALIEAMKTFNPVKAGRSGKIVRALVTDAQAVEFGEPLFEIE